MANNEVTLTELINIISKIQLNYTFLAKSWYDIFYNPTPIERIDINFYDDSGKLQVCTVPNLAYSRQYYTQGEGSPDGVLAAPKGTIYQDTTNGEAYLKYYGTDNSTSGWVKFVTENDLHEFVRTGGVPPENNITAPAGTLYIYNNQDDGTAYLYMKRTSTGSTGWERIDSYPTSMVKQVFEVPQGTTTVQVPMKCESESLLTVYVDGTLIRPDKYRLWNDQQTIEFGYTDIDGSWIVDPLKAPEVQTTLDVVVVYYTDIHLYDGGVTQEYNDLLNECKEVAEQVKLSADMASDAVNRLEINIDEAVETATKLATEAIVEAASAYDAHISEVCEKVETDLLRISNVVKSDYVEIGDWYNKISQMQTSVAEMQRDVATMRKNIMDNSHFLWSMNIEDQLMLKDTYVPELERIESKITTEDNGLRNEFMNNIARVDQDIANKEDNLNNNINELRTAFTTSDSELRGELSSFKEENRTEHDSFQQKLDNMENVYYREDTFPIGLKTTYQYNKYINTDAKSRLEEDKVIVYLRRDCMYYTIDLGKFMNDLERDAVFDGFELRPGGTYTNDITGMLDEVDEENPDAMIDSETYTNVIIQARVMFKNDSTYKPVIIWDEKSLTWMGNEEPDFEPGKNYLIEFISYDIGGTWYAHMMGVCQPAVRTDDITMEFNITLTDNELGDGVFDFYYDTDAEDRIYLTTQSSVDNIINFVYTTPRKHKGTEIQYLRVHKQGSPENEKFVKYCIVPRNEVYTVADGMKVEATISLAEDNKYTDDIYTYTIKIMSPDVDAFIRDNVVVPVTEMTLDQLKGYLEDDETVGVRYVRLIQTENEIDYYGQITGFETIVQEKDRPDDEDTYMDVIKYEIEGREYTKEVQEFMLDETFKIELTSPYFQKVEDSEVGMYECTDIKVKARFSDSAGFQYDTVSYVYDPGDTYNHGITITLTTDPVNDPEGYEILSNCVEWEGTVNNFLKEIKLQYPGNEEGKCMIWSTYVMIPDEESEDGGMVELDTEPGIQLGLDEEANVMLENIGDWE